MGEKIASYVAANASGGTSTVFGRGNASPAGAALANGTFGHAIDYSMDNIGLLDEPIKLTVDDGYVTEVSGGSSAAQLREIIESADDNARNLTEFAIGTNPDARLIGNFAEDKKKTGTVHFAIDDDTSLGGTRKSEIHFDGLVTRPDVTLDDYPASRTEHCKRIGFENSQRN